MNAANEAAVARFIKGEIRFTDIPYLIEKTLQAHQPYADFTLKQIMETHDWAVDFAQSSDDLNKWKLFIE